MSDTVLIVLINPTQKELDMVKERFSPPEQEWLNAEQFRFKLIQKGYRNIKSVYGLRSFCRKNNIPFEKPGKEYLFANPINLPSLK